MASGTRAVFLDRDGVLNYNRSDHIKTPEEYVPIPGAASSACTPSRNTEVVPPSGCVPGSKYHSTQLHMSGFIAVVEQKLDGN